MKNQPSGHVLGCGRSSPFLILGSYQTYSRDHIRNAQILQRDLERSGTLLIPRSPDFHWERPNNRNRSCPCKDGIIEEVFNTRVPDPNSYKAIVIEGSGKTLLPGLIDVHVHLAAPAGFSESSPEFDLQKACPGLWPPISTVESLP